MLITLAFVFLVCWLLAFVAFKVTVGVVHLLLVVALIAFVLHFVRGRAAH